MILEAQTAFLRDFIDAIVDGPYERITCMSDGTLHLSGYHSTSNKSTHHPHHLTHEYVSYSSKSHNDLFIDFYTDAVDINAWQWRVILHQSRTLVFLESGNGYNLNWSHSILSALDECARRIYRDDPILGHIKDIKTRLINFVNKLNTT